jgi:hypothetical protein
LNIFPMIPFVIFAVLCIATIVAIPTFRHLMMEDPEKLLTKIATREDPLLDYVEKLENINIDDEALWVAVGRVRGLLQLSRDACRCSACIRPCTWDKETMLNIDSMCSVSRSSSPRFRDARWSRSF